MEEKRKHVRTEFSGHLKLMHPRLGAHKVEMRDLSDGGLFVFLPEGMDISADETVKVQSLDIDDAPILSARVVRSDAKGIALMFIDLDE